MSTENAYSVRYGQSNAAGMDAVQIFASAKKDFLDTDKDLIENDVHGNEAIYATSTNQLNS